MDIAEIEAKRLIEMFPHDKADDELEKEISKVKRDVLDICPSLSEFPYRLAACISLAHSIGIDSFSKSSVCRYIRRCEYKAALYAFGALTYDGYYQYKELINRRRAERGVFMRDDARHHVPEKVLSEV